MLASVRVILALANYRRLSAAKPLSLAKPNKQKQMAVASLSFTKPFGTLGALQGLYPIHVRRQPGYCSHKCSQCYQTLYTILYTILAPNSLGINENPTSPGRPRAEAFQQRQAH
ncbi:hypothetical protein GGR55DRAFT_636268 [Xylaria sp. FL0064]|nr:hypothetical protein GGR55DRAFT_636268 [Xylaria sp. FL0064]